jgi:hypothetical protein
MSTRPPALVVPVLGVAAAALRARTQQAGAHTERALRYASVAVIAHQTKGYAYIAP